MKMDSDPKPSKLVMVCKPSTARVLPCANAEALIQRWRDIVVPGEPVLGGERLQRQTHHLGVAGASGWFLPDDPQSGDDPLIERAGGADDADRTTVDRVTHSHTGSH